MTENDLRYLHLKRIYNIFKEARPNEKCELVTEYANWSLISSSYIVSCSKKKNPHEVKKEDIVDFDLDFEISFEVFTLAEYVAKTMQLLLIAIKPQDVRVTENFYYDSDDEKIYWGREAYNEKIRGFQKKQGKVECPVCERYVEKKSIDKKTGYCGYCNKHVDDIVFH